MEITPLTPNEAGMLRRLLLDEKKVLVFRRDRALVGSVSDHRYRTGQMLVQGLLDKLKPLLDDLPKGE